MNSELEEQIISIRERIKALRTALSSLIQEIRNPGNSSISRFLEDFKLRFNCIMREKASLNQHIREIRKSSMPDDDRLNGLMVEIVGNFECFENELKNSQALIKRTIQNKKRELLSSRIYVPQQYAGIEQYQQGCPQILIATHGMGPCVGIAMYCEASRCGMVTHLDSDHFSERNTEEVREKQIGQMQAYFQKLIRKMDIEKGQKITGTVVISSSEHEGLDTTINEQLKVLSTHLSPSGIELLIDEKKVDKDAACLVLNLENGEVYTDYNEVEKEPNAEDEKPESKRLRNILNAPNSFMLYHLRDGGIHEQDLEQITSWTVGYGILEPIATRASSRNEETQSATAVVPNAPAKDASGLNREILEPRAKPPVSFGTVKSAQAVTTQLEELGRTVPSRRVVA